jgi:predicted acylesterase/phospholipase RssA
MVAHKRGAFATFAMLPSIVLVSFVCWSLVSPVVDNFETRSQSLARDTDRFSHLSSARKFGDLRIGLALSGGGYRAALIHAGVLHAFEQFGLRFSNLSTVSGGSIIGAWYTIGGSPDDFVRAVTQGRFRIKRDALQFPAVFALNRRAEIQSRRLDQVCFGEIALNHNNARAPSEISADMAPRLLIGTTNLLDGASIGWGATFLVRRPISHPGEGNFVNAPYPALTDVQSLPDEFSTHQSLASLVAASGAFPLAFNPVAVLVGDGDSASRYLLVDGGISDNTGLDLLIECHRTAVIRFGTRRLWYSNSDPWAKLMSGPFVLPEDKLPKEMQVDKSLRQHFPASDWRLNYIIASDAGAALASKNAFGSVDGLSQAVDIIARNVRPRSNVPPASTPRFVCWALKRPP